MAVQHELGAELAQHVAHLVGIAQSSEMMRAFGRRMMDQHHAERVLATECAENVAKPRQLIAVQLAGRSERRGWQRGREPDDAQRTSTAHERKVFSVFVKDAATPELYALSLRDALPVCETRTFPRVRRR